MNLPKNFSIQNLKKWYSTDRITPEAVFTQIVRRMGEHHQKNIWIKSFDLDLMMSYLEKANPDSPLYGIPFAIKDNIDLKGIETTAGCPSYAYIPEKSAFVVDQLMQAGAIPVGKTNMDQFATGLVGTRSPFGECLHSVHESCISGGSSSGSAVALALGMCAFSLGTDTAGSGRVPAALNKINGYKPTPGLLSIEGVVPACLSLDTVSLFHHHHEDLKKLLPVVSVKNKADAFQKAELKSILEDHRPFATIDPNTVEWKGAGNCHKFFKQGIQSLQAQGFEMDVVNVETFFEVARLLYEGPWVAERYAAVGEFIQQGEPDLDPTVKKIILGAKNLKAVDAFKAQYKLTEKQHLIEEFFKTYQGLLLPTIGGWFSREELQKNPVELNSYLGTFTNFANLLKLSACSFPVNVPVLNDQPGCGLTLFMPGGEDLKVIETSGKMSEALDYISLAVCGAHLSGEPLNHQLTELGAVFRRCTRTTPNYEMVALSSFKPGMYRNEVDGFAIEVEVWDIPAKNLGAFVDKIDSPLGVGKVEICDGQMVTGFLIENYVVEGLKNISKYGGWRQYKNSDD